MAYPAINYIVSLLKVCALYLKSDNFKEVMALFQHPSLSYPEDLDVLMRDCIRTSRRLVRMFQVLLSLTLVGYVATPFLDSSQERPMPHQLPRSITSYIQSTSSSLYLLLYFSMSVFTALSAFLSICVDMLFTAFCSILSAHLQVLREKIKLITSSKSDETEELDGKETRRKLRGSVTSHQIIFEYVYRSGSTG